MVSNNSSFTHKIRNPEWLEIYLKLKEEKKKTSSQNANEKRISGA
jgi:hypothetical protein